MHTAAPAPPWTVHCTTNISASPVTITQRLVYSTCHYRHSFHERTLQMTYSLGGYGTTSHRHRAIGIFDHRTSPRDSRNLWSVEVEPRSLCRAPLSSICQRRRSSSSSSSSSSRCPLSPRLPFPHPPCPRPRPHPARPPLPLRPGQALWGLPSAAALQRSHLGRRRREEK